MAMMKGIDMEKSSQSCYKQRVLMQRHQGENASHGLFRIFIETYLFNTSIKSQFFNVNN